MRPNIFPTVAAVDLVTGGRDEKRVPRGEVGARGPIARIEDLDDLTGQRQSATAVAFGPDDVDVPGIQIDLPGLQGAGFAGPQPARMHQREERDCLPSPRGLHLQLCCGGEE
jgi:hypothetical protein